MAQKFVTPITIKNLASSGSDALTVFLNGEVYGRVKLEAGGRISWGGGEGGYDTNIYRDSANVLATDDVLKATAGIITMAVAGVPTAALADGALAVDTTNNTFYFRANGAWSEISGNSTITVSDTAPADAEVGALWFDSTSLEMFIYYGSAWVQLNADTGAEELSDLFDIEFNNLIAGEILKYDGEKWVNETGPSITVSDTAPTGSFAGDLWYDSTSLEMFIYYGGNWVEVNAETGAEELSDLFDIEFANLASGQVLKYNGEKWVNDTDNAGTTISSIDDINDVTITSATSGQFLKWNGSAWVNDAIDLSTDTVGNYVSGLSAGTGISVTHTPGEGSTPTVGLNATVNDLSDTTITSPANGQVLQWNGTAWVNAAAASGGATVNVAETAPADPSTGDLWFESDTAKTFIYYDSQWIEVGPQPGGGAQALTTKGDLLSRDASNFARLAVGTNGYFLKADSSTSTGLVWAAIPTINNLDDIGDVTITSVSSGQVLKWNGTAWANAADNAGTTISSIDDITDVTITSVQNGDLLKWNGTAWVNAAGYALLASPALTGIPTAPTAAAATNTTQIATTEFVTGAITDLIGGAPGALNTLNELAEAIGDDASYAAGITTALGLKAPLASPTFTGTVTIPTGASITAPTGLVKGDVGLGNVDNTSNSTERAATATLTNKTLTSPVINTPTGIVKGDVGLGNVDNTSDASKPVSTAQQTALDLKANLASPTFTGTVTVPTPTNNTDASTKAYVDAAQSAAQVYADNLTVSLSEITDGITADASEINILDGATLSTAELNILDGATLSVTELNYVDGVTSAIQTQLNSKAPIASPTFTGTVSGVTKTMVGLGSVDNTTDANKPVSTATQTALDLKSNLASPTFTGTLTANDVTVSGNLTVSGTTTSINTETVTVDDNIIILNNNATGAPSVDAGIEIERGSSTNVLIRWNETTDKWQFTNDGSTYTDLGIGSASISSTAPTSPVSGQIWFYQDTAQTFVYYGSNWIEIGAVSNGARLEVSSVAPASPATGDLWFDSDTAQTFTYYDSQWIEIGASGMAASVGDSAPASPVNGQIWFDSANASTNVYYDSQWVEVGGGGGSTVSISDSAPSSPTAGTLWFNSTSGATFIYYGSVWVEVGVAPFDQLLSTLDAKGDLLVGTADNTVTKLGAGSNNQVLTVDSTTASGLKWSTPTVYQAVVSGVSDTEIGYLDGVTSAIQTQLDTKASTGKAIAMSIVFGS